MKVKPESNECIAEGSQPSNLTASTSSTGVSVSSTDTSPTTVVSSAELSGYGSFNYLYPSNPNTTPTNDNGSRSLQTPTTLSGFVGLPYWPISGPSTSGSATSVDVVRYDGSSKSQSLSTKEK